VNTSQAFIFLVTLMMLFLGLRIRKDEFLKVFKSPEIVASGLIIYTLIWPATVFLICSLSGISSDLSLALVLMATTPAGGTGGMLANIAGGDSPLTVVIMGLYSLFAIISIPVFIVMAQLNFQGSTVGFVNLYWLPLLISLMLLPVFLGIYLRHRFSHFVVRCDGLFKRLSSLIVILMIVICLVQEWSRLNQTSFSFVSIMVGMSILGLILSYFVARLVSGHTQSISIGMGASNPNCGLALALAVSPQIYPNGDVVFPVVINSGITLLVGLIAAQIFAKVINRRV